MTDPEHYSQARDRALDELKARWNPRRLRNLGARPETDNAVELSSLKWTLRFSLEPFEAKVLPEEEHMDIRWQVLALDYLAAFIPPPAAEFLSFTDFAELRTYRDTYEKRVEQRLIHGAGADEEQFADAARSAKGELKNEVPMIWEFPFFPLFHLQIAYHRGDEELSSACKVMFPDNALKLLSPESAIVAAESLVGIMEGKTPGK